MTRRIAQRARFICDHFLTLFDIRARNVSPVTLAHAARTELAIDAVRIGESVGQSREDVVRHGDRRREGNHVREP
jgi:hypothetical protein